MDISWSPRAETDLAPAWTRPNPAMGPSPLTIEQRAKVIEMVCGMAMELPARDRGELEFPPFRTLTHR